MLSPSGFHRGGRIITGGALFLAVSGWTCLVAIFLLNEDGQPQDEWDDYLLFGSIAQGALVVVLGIISFILALAGWIWDRARPGVLNLILLIQALGASIPLLLFGAFAIGFAEHNLLSDLCALGATIAGVLAVILTVLTIWLFVLAKSESRSLPL